MSESTEVKKGRFGAFAEQYGERWAAGHPGAARKAPAGPDCFVHRFDLRAGDFKTLHAGERVEFAIVELQNRPWAGDVTKPHPNDGVTVQ